MHSKIITLAAVLGMVSLPAFAESAIQPGDTLESLSKVRISTTVNGQPGSIKQLAAAGQIKVAEADLPVSVEDIDSIMEETTAPEAAKVEAPAAETKPVEAAKAEVPATEKKPVEASKAATETAPAAEEMVSVEDIDPAEPV